MTYLLLVITLALSTSSGAVQWRTCQRTAGSDIYTFPDCGCEVTLLNLKCSDDTPLPFAATIDCNDRKSNYTGIPGPPDVGSTLDQLSLVSCELPDRFQALLERLGQPEAVLSQIYLEHVRGALRREHVLGLRAVRKLVIRGTAMQTQIPFDALDALTGIEELNLVLCGQVVLEASGRDDPAPPAHPTLQSLRLLSCDVPDVPPGAFVRLGRIQKLYLGYNLIKKITRDSFRGLSDLQTLDLSGNPITALPPHAFQHAARLRTLQLHETHLSEVPGEALAGLTRLETVTIEKGKGTITFGAAAFAALPALKYLTIKSSRVDALPADLLEGSTALEELTIRDTGLENVPKDLLRTQSRLKKLDLSRNKIEALDRSIFHHLDMLYELNLDSNRIKELPNSLFSGLSKLKSVSISNNSLEHIDESALDESCESLRYLYLEHNFLTTEALSPLRLSWALPRLEELHLQGNRLTRVIADWQRLGEMRKLDLSNNYFTSLQEMHLMFQSFGGLEIDLRHNQITSVQMHDLLPGVSETKDYITHVLLSDNPFSCDCDLYMFIKALHWSDRSYIAALKLDVEHAQCASPPELAGRRLRNLPLALISCPLRPDYCPPNCSCIIHPASRSLKLECRFEPPDYPEPFKHGQITTQLRLKTIQSLALPPHVTSLNLTGLGLTEPPPVEVLQHVETLDLSNNNLTGAPTELLKANISLRLAGNPFKCDCSHLDNIYALQLNAASFDADNVKCDTGDELVYVMYIRPNELCKDRWVVLDGALAAVGLLFGVIVGIAYRYHFELRVFLFSRGWCRSWIQEDDLDDGAEYDAFVSFSQQDAQWVAENLVPNLEGEPNNFKLCVHYRDWVVGEMIPAQIATSVERSRRTIVVLTEHFLKSTWASLEFRAANVRAQRDRRARVLVVVLGEVPACDEMDAELRAYLSTNTYLKWGDPWFWEKLKYAMPHRRQIITQDVVPAETEVISE